MRISDWSSDVCSSDLAGKNASRPDGLVQVSFGKSTWTALVEVKTGTATLDAEQINGYWDIAREQNFDAVVTISNEIAPSKEAHPTDGLKVRANSRVKVHHYSWTDRKITTRNSSH